MTSSKIPTSEIAVVAIGVSASELFVLEDFLAHLPEQFSDCLVVIESLPRGLNSSLAEWVSSQTQMIVQYWEADADLIPNRVYVVPSGHCLQAIDGQLHLTAVADETTLVIDASFQALAERWGDRTIGILFSGTGDDGLQGLQAISQRSGVALLQLPDTSQFVSQPDGVLPFGLTDEILSPKALAELVYDLTQFLGSASTSKKDLNQGMTTEQLQRILDILVDQGYLNCSHYKVTTLSRRIAHRYALSNYPELEEYIHYLRNSPEEQERLRQDLMIGVTSFFRDAPAWSLLATQVLPKVLDRLAPGEPLRLWVAACSTGEEAYSFAILVDEVMETHRQRMVVKIFATDLDTEALNRASKGIYPATIANHVSPERLERYFTQEGDRFVVKRSLREMVIFATHDLTQHVGFSQMHLVSCRNMLIYMRPDRQQQILRCLHFALVPQGVLFLGNSENLGNLASEFAPLSNKWKLFQKLRDVRLPITGNPRQSLVPTLPLVTGLRERSGHFDRLLSEVFQFCFQDRQLTCLLVSPENLLIHIFDNSAQLLAFPVAATRLEVISMVLPELRLPLSTALHKAKHDRQPVAYSQIPLSRHETTYSVTLRVNYQPTNPALDNHLIVVFELDSPPASAVAMPTFAMNTDTAHQIAELEYELQQTRDNLQLAIEDLETTNEELQAANEELLASNEELQSVNEELQSTNEELFAVNTEHQQKIEALTQLTTDFDNLLRSTNIGVVFLDANLNLRKFTPAASHIINIRPTDVNRPLSHFTHNLDCPHLLDLLWQVLASEQPLEQEVTLTTTGDHLLMGVSCYCREDDICDGLVITFVGINHLKAIQSQLQRRTDHLEQLYATAPVGLAVIDQQFTYVQANDHLARLNGLATAGDMIGQSVAAVLPDLAEDIMALCQQVFTTNQPLPPFEATGPHPSRSNIQGAWLSSYYPLQLIDGRRAVGVAVVEITDRKQAELELARSRELREAIFSQSTDAIFLVDTETLLILDCNDRAVELFQVDHKADLIGLAGHSLQKTPFTPAEIEAIVAEMQEKGIWEREIEYVTRRGNVFWGNLAARTITVAGHNINLVRVKDVSDRKRAEQLLANYNQTLETQVAERTAALLASETRFENLVANLPGVVYRYLLRPDGSHAMLYVSPGCRNLWELEPHQIEQDVDLTWAMIHPEDVAATKASILMSAQTLQPWHQEWRIMTPSGQFKWVQGASKPERQANGDVIWDGLVLDITARKEVEERFQSLLFNIPGAVFRYTLHADGSDGVAYLNPGCYELWEVEASQVEQDASLLWKMIHPEDLPAIQQSVMESAQTLRPWSFQWRIITPSGRLKWLEASGKPQRYPNGDVVWNTMILEVTDRKEAEAHLVELEELNRLKDEFLSSVSHELRTPITNIKMSVQMLEIALAQSRGADTINHYLSILKQETKREADLINDLLELSRLDSGTQALNLSEIDLPLWIPQLVGAFHDRLTAQEQQLVLDLPADLPTMTTEPALLERVLNELVNNACKYSPRHATLTIAARITEVGIDLSVTNTGVEINAQEQDRIFEKFYRIPKNDPWKYGGTGLGLAIVKKLVVCLGGTLTLTSGNHQTQFTLHLPLALSHPFG